MKDIPFTYGVEEVVEQSLIDLGTGGQGEVITDGYWKHWVFNNLQYHMSHFGVLNNLFLDKIFSKCTTVQWMCRGDLPSII